VAAAVSALGDDARDIDIATNVGRVLAEPVGRRGDALHPGFRVDDEDDREVERLGDHRSAGTVAVVEPHHALDDAHVTVATFVVATQAGTAFEPQVERPGGRSRHGLVVARVDEVRPGFRGLDLVTRRLQGADDSERRHGLADARPSAADDEPLRRAVLRVVRKRYLRHQLHHLATP